MIHKYDLITLRPLRATDISATFRWRNNPETVALTMGYRFPVTEEMEKEWFTQNTIDRKDRINYAIDNAVGQIIGVARLLEIDWISRNATLTFMIGDKENRRQGLGGAALKALLEVARDVYNLRKISLDVIMSENGAAPFYAGIGFTHEGLRQKHFWSNDCYYDVAIMSIFLQ